MKKPTRTLGMVGLLTITAILAAGCQTIGVQPSPTITPLDFIGTSVFETAEAAFTETAVAAPPTELVTTPSPTVAIPDTGATPTLLPSPTELVIVSPTPQVATASPAATGTPAPATQTSPTAAVTRVVTTPILQTPGIPPTGGQVILEDDFETRQSWFASSTTDFRMYYSNNGYRMANNFRDSFISSVRSFARADVYMEVDAMQTAGPDSGLYGLVCRWSDIRNHYGFLIGADGSYAIVRNLNGEITFLAQGDEEQTGFETGLNVTNRIAANCSGPNLTLYVNDQPLLSVQDTTFTSGVMGLMVLTQDGAVEAHFDNFLARAP